MGQTRDEALIAGRAVLDALPTLMLAIGHGTILYGIFDRDPRALWAAELLEHWMLAEAGALIIVPYLMGIAAGKFPSRFEAALTLPAVLLVLGGATGLLLFVKAFWLYALVRAVTVWWARPTEMQAEAGCARSLVGIGLLVVLAAVFANRPYRWPIGTVIGRQLAERSRYLANLMAYGAAYFGALAVCDAVIGYVVRRHGIEDGDRRLS